MKTTGIYKTLNVALILLCSILLTSRTVYADTDGTELQVAQPSSLEIQLGPGWAGVEFQMKTDAGLYPGTITVGADGVLRTELGGSTSYVLSCLSSSGPAPSPEETAAASAPGISETETATHGRQDPETDLPEESEAPVTAEAESGVGGIPVKHIILYAGGFLLAIGCLAGIAVAKNRRAARRAGEAYDDEDEW